VIDFNYRRPIYKKGMRWLRPGTRVAMGPAAWLNRH
jgi:hypothetical protein